MLKYQGVLIAVQDVAVSRRFYEECLGQKVALDLGVNVGFEGGLAIHQKGHFQDLLGGEKTIGLEVFPRNPQVNALEVDAAVPPDPGRGDLHVGIGDLRQHGAGHPRQPLRPRQVIDSPAQDGDQDQQHR